MAKNRVFKSFSRNQNPKACIHSLIVYNLHTESNNDFFDMVIEPKLRYSDEELKEFEILISEKLEKAKKELSYIMDSITRKNESGTEATAGGILTMDDSAETAEKEQLTQLAARLQKFTNQLEMAAIRVKNKTYGICIDSGKLIPKERLRAVPHTQHSIEAKQQKK